jgi:hypothetical protein
MPVRKNQTPVFPECSPVRRCGVDGLDPRVDRLVRDPFVLRPIWDQTPTKHVEFVVSRLGVFPDRQNVLTRRDVVTDWQIELRLRALNRFQRAGQFTLKRSRRIN